MLYEGHQEDAELETYLRELKELVLVRLLARGKAVDALSVPRDIAVVERI